MHTKHEPSRTSAKPRRSLSLASLIIVPLKQHLGCCVILPALLKTIGSAGILGSLLLFPQFHFYIALGMAPLIVWLCIKLEDLYHSRQHRSGHFAHGHAHTHSDSCSTCEPCPVDHTAHGFWRRFAFNLAIAIIMVVILEHFHDHGNL